ncbi:MAG: HAD family hydrolase [Archaeoglobaceae archaeon]|nr:HAD family hydrolase [Archaeoglobaceae archaeon]
MKPKIISFDVDGTLVNQDFANKFWHELVPKLYAEKHGLNYKDAKEYVRKCYAEVGEEDIRWYLPDYWFKRFGLDDNPKDVLEEYKNELKIYDDAIDALEKLHKKYDLIVISNASKDFLDVELEDLRNYFKCIFSCVSDLKKVRKEPEVYVKICRHLKIHPTEVAHVGDHYKFDYVVPKSVGIDAYLVDRQRKYEKALKDLREFLTIFNFDS